MSHKLTELVYSKVCGSAVRKQILVRIADRAGDDGDGYWGSTARLAKELERDKRTVQRYIRALIEDGLLVKVGKRSVSNGYVVEYRMDLEVLNALPAIDPRQEQKRPQQTGGAEPPDSGRDAASQRAPNHPNQREPKRNQTRSVRKRDRAGMRCGTKTPDLGQPGKPYQYILIGLDEDHCIEEWRDWMRANFCDDPDDLLEALRSDEQPDCFKLPCRFPKDREEDRELYFEYFTELSERRVQSKQSAVK